MAALLQEGNQTKNKVKLTAEQEELCKLRKEVKKLLMEREILKKAAAFFANQPN
jgi:transposase